MGLMYRPKIFQQFEGVRAAMTSRGSKSTPFGHNLSLSIGDKSPSVVDRRRKLALKLGFDLERLAVGKQVHGSTVVEVHDGFTTCECDALITREPGWLLAVSVADCVPVLMYDPEHHVAAAVHSGWRGSEQAVARAAVNAMREHYGTDPATLHVYIGPSAGACCYEVGDDVASKFYEHYSRRLSNGRYLFDNKRVVLDMLLAAGVPSLQIELDARCTICDTSLHSYRREGLGSGRMFGVIGLSTSGE